MYIYRLFLLTALQYPQFCIILFVFIYNMTVSCCDLVGAETLPCSKLASVENLGQLSKTPAKRHIDRLHIEFLFLPVALRPCLCLEQAAPTGNEIKLLSAQRRRWWFQQIRTIWLFWVGKWAEVFSCRELVLISLCCQSGGDDEGDASAWCWWRWR